MPGYDGTGPNGQGPLTGRGLGPCGRRVAFRRGFGRGRGRGFRCRYLGPQMVPQPINEEETLEDKKEAIEQEIQFLEEGLVEFKKRLKDLR